MEKIQSYTKSIKMNADLLLLVFGLSFAFVMFGYLLITSGTLLGLVFCGIGWYFSYICYRIRKTPYIRTTEDGITIYRYLQHKKETTEWENIQEILFKNGRIEILLSNDKKVKIDLSLVDEDDKEDLKIILRRFFMQKIGFGTHLRNQPPI